MEFKLAKESDAPFYKQIVEFVISEIHNGNAAAGDMLPSMNELSDALGISKETVKKAYSMLRDRGFLEARQGKGVFICDPEDRTTQRILVLFDKMSPYKDITFNAMAARIGGKAQLTIRLHNQSPELLKYYLDESLDKYDYYVITANFPLDEVTQKAVHKQLVRIPNRKLIVLDNWMKELQGNYGAVYQDFDNDIYEGLDSCLEELKKYSRLNVITLPSSLYHKSITNAIKRFCTDKAIPVEFYSHVTDNLIRKGEVYILLNGQLDSDLNDFARAAKRKNIEIGKDIGIISYNDYPINELVLGGLTTVSADFAQMGDLAARMILDKNMEKIKCDFHLVRRATF